MFVPLIFCLLFIQQCLSHYEIKQSDMNVQQQLMLFTKYYVDFNKSYSSIDEFAQRFKYFQDSLAEIAELNANEYDTAVYGLNKFSDHSPEEFKQLCGFQKIDEEFLEDIDFADIPNIELPESFDWRDHNAVTPVKNQGNCGSCWAFSAVGNIEGQYAIKHKKLVSFSEQELVSCSNRGCWLGWWPMKAYGLVKELGGIDMEKSYPYVSGKNIVPSCEFKKNEVVGKVTGYNVVSSNEDDMAKWLVQNGPISIAIDVNNWGKHYQSGIYKPSNGSCSGYVDHAVLIVGFGEKDGTKYWIIKNSWGTDHGIDGYILLQRGVDACSVNKYTSTSIVA